MANDRFRERERERKRREEGEREGKERGRKIGEGRETCGSEKIVFKKIRH